MLENLINLILLVGFILAVLNIIKTIFQYIPIIRQGIKYKPTDKEIFLIGLSIAYSIAISIKQFTI